MHESCVCLNHSIKTNDSTLFSFLFRQWTWRRAPPLCLPTDLPDVKLSLCSRRYPSCTFQQRRYRGRRYRGRRYRGLRYRGRSYHGRRYRGLRYRGGVTVDTVRRVVNEAAL